MSYCSNCSDTRIDPMSLSTTRPCPDCRHLNRHEHVKRVCLWHEKHSRVPDTWGHYGSVKFAQGWLARQSEVYEWVTTEEAQAIRVFCGWVVPAEQMRLL